MPEQVELKYLFHIGLVESLNVRVLCGLAWMNSNHDYSLLVR